MKKIIFHIPDEPILGRTDIGEIQKMLNKQKIKTNRGFTLLAAFTVLYFMAAEIRIQEQDSKIEYLNREIEKLKTSEGEQ